MKSQNYNLDRFDSFMLGTDRVDLTTHRVTAPDGTHFELSYSAMLFLKALAARPGALVSTPELCRLIWGATPESLARDSAEIAHHFNDDPDNPKYIEYLDGVGYRLLQTVHPGDLPFNAKFSRLFFLELNRRKVFRAAALYCLVAFVALQISDATFAALALPPAAVPILITTLIIGFPLVVVLAWFLELKSGSLEKDAQSGWFQLMGRRWEVAALISLFAISSFFAFSVSQSIRFDTRFSEVRVAVMPFRNLTADEDSDYLSNGITEEVASALTHFDGILVAARSDAHRFADREITVTATAQELGVEFLVEGSLIRIGGQMKVAVQLVSGLTGKNVQAVIFDVDDLAKISFEIAESIGYTMGGAGAPMSGEDQTHGDTNAVYRHYLKGTYLLASATSIEDYREAQADVEQAIRLGGRFRRAESALCQILYGIHHVGNELAATRMAERQCQRAVAMEKPDLKAMIPYGRLLLAVGKHDKAEKIFRRALTANRFNVDAQAGLAVVLEHIGREQFTRGNWQDARASWQRAFELHPTPNLHTQIGRLDYVEGDLYRARRILENGTDKFPDNDAIWGQLGLVYIAESRSAEAAFTRAAELNRKNDPISVARNSAYLAFLGELEEARLIVSNELILKTDDPEAQYWLSLALSMVGNESQVLQALAKALGSGLPHRLLVNDPNLAKYAQRLMPRGVESM